MFLRRTKRPAMNRIAQIDGLERNRELQESLELRQRVLIVAALAAHGEDDVIVAETFRVPEAMQSVGHFTPTVS